VNGAGSALRIDAATASLDIAEGACPRMDNCASVIEVTPSVSLASSLSALAAARVKSPLGAPRAGAVRSTRLRPGNSLAAVGAVAPATGARGAREGGAGGGAGQRKGPAIAVGVPAIGLALRWQDIGTPQLQTSREPPGRRDGGVENLETGRRSSDRIAGVDQREGSALELRRLSEA